MAAAYRDPLFVEEEVPIRDDMAHRAGVRSLTGRTAALPAESASASFTSYFIEYDGQGSRIRHEKFDRSGKLVGRWLYDGQGRLCQEIVYDPNGNVHYRLDLIGGGNGWTEKRMYYLPDRLHYRIAADRDASGRLSRATYLDSAGQAIRSDSYDYDSRGLLTRVVMGHMGECVYEYDERRNLKRRCKNLPGMSVFGDVQEFEHDDRNLLIRMEHLHFSVTTFAFTFA